MISALLLLAGALGQDDGWLAGSVHNGGSNSLTLLCTDPKIDTYWYQVDIALEDRRNVLLYRKVQADKIIVKNEMIVPNSLAFFYKNADGVRRQKFVVNSADVANPLSVIIISGTNPKTFEASVNGLQLNCERTPVLTVLEKLSQVPEMDVE